MKTLNCRPTLSALNAWYVFNMAETKRARKKVSKSKTKRKSTAAKVKVTTAAKQSKQRKISGKKVGPTRKKLSSKPAKGIRSLRPSTLGGSTFPTGERRSRSGIGPRSAGQSGDLQDVSRKPLADSESVEELLEEGQAREAAAITGVEGALDPDQGEVQTREVPADDVPREYIEED